MWETLIVLCIVVIAIVYLARRFFNKKKSCGCGGCGSSPTAPVTHSCCMCDEEKVKKRE